MKNPLHLHIMIKMWAAVQDYKWPSISQIMFLFRDHTPQYRSPCTKKLNNTYNIFLQEGGLSSQNLPITHHVVCIRKKLGLCIDCRLLNQKTILTDTLFLKLVKKLTHKWRKLHLEGVLLYCKTEQRHRFILPAQYKQISTKSSSTYMTTLLALYTVPVKTFNNSV